MFTKDLAYGELDYGGRESIWGLVEGRDAINWWELFRPVFREPWPYHWQSGWVLL